jgi:fructan beta-fructosidase
MSNWQYANKVPTEKWRSAMTMPRDLALEKMNGKYYVISTPSKEIDKLQHEIKSQWKVLRDLYAIKRNRQASA